MKMTQGKGNIGKKTKDNYLLERKNFVKDQFERIIKRNLKLPISILSL